MEQNWGESWIVPKNTKESKTQMQNNALISGSEAVYKGKGFFLIYRNIESDICWR